MAESPWGCGSWHGSLCLLGSAVSSEVAVQCRTLHLPRQRRTRPSCCAVAMHLTAQAPGIWEPSLFPTPPVGQGAAWVEDNPGSWPDNPGSRGASGSEGLHFAQDDGPAGSAVIDRCMD